MANVFIGGIGSARRKKSLYPTWSQSEVISWVNVMLSHELKEKWMRVENIKDALRIAKKYEDKWQYRVTRRNGGFVIVTTKYDRK